MKSFLLALLVFITTTGFAQKATDKIVINTPGVQCENCKKRIENSLVREYGVSSVKVDFKKHNVTVVYIKDRTNSENIKTAIANIGYDAGDVTAEADAIRRLPKACQHPVEATPIK